MRIYSVGIVLLFVLICGACRAGSSNTIRVAYLDSGIIPAAVGTVEKNYVVDWINSKSPVKVKFEAISRDGMEQKIQTIFASGDAPDLMLNNNMNSLVDQGLIQEITSAFDKYAPNYRKYSGDLSPDYLKFAKASNEKEYGIISIAPDYNLANYCLYVRKDWLDKLGLSIPKTTDELYAAAKAIKDKGLGYGFDLAGRGVYAPWLVSEMFKVHGSDWAIMPDGSLELGFLTDNMRDAVAFMRKLYQEGIVNPEYITGGQVKAEQLFTTGKLGFLPSNKGRMLGITRALLTNDPSAEVVAIPTPLGPYGQGGYSQDRKYSPVYVVPASSKKLNAVAKYIDWVITQGGLYIYGDEGKHFKLVNNKKIYGLTPELAQDLSIRASYFAVRLDATQGDLDSTVSQFAPESADAITKKVYAVYKQGILAAIQFPPPFSPPTQDFGIKEYYDVVPGLTNPFFVNAMNKAITSKDYTPAQMIADVRKEAEARGYPALKSKTNDTAKKLGYIK